MNLQKTRKSILFFGLLSITAICTSLSSEELETVVIAKHTNKISHSEAILKQGKAISHLIQDLDGINKKIENNALPKSPIIVWKKILFPPLLVVNLFFLNTSLTLSI